MFVKDLQGELNLAQLLQAGVRTATVQGTGTDMKDFIGLPMVILQCPKASAGTNPTMNVTLEHSDDNVAFTAFDVPIAFTQVTDQADLLQALGVDMRVCKRYLRAVATIGGTVGPSFPSVGVVLVGYKQTA